MEYITAYILLLWASILFLIILAFMVEGLSSVVRSVCYLLGRRRRMKGSHEYGEREPVSAGISLGVMAFNFCGKSQEERDMENEGK